jgi:tripartite-type tricarboxylate transporter receptor subunit TctC
VIAFKAQPGKLCYGSSGVGTSSHRWVEIFQRVTGASYTHIPYKDEAASLQDVGGGHLQFVFINASLPKPPVASDKVVPVAYAAAQRTPLFPQVPTVDEAGWKGFNVRGRDAFIAPVGLPADVMKKISAALQQAVLAPEVHERIRSLGFTLVASTPEAFAQRLRSEIRDPSHGGSGAQARDHRLNPSDRTDLPAPGAVLQCRP